MKNTLRISVRNLVEFVMRSGDIDTSYVSQDRAVQGIMAHKKLQSEYEGYYKPEFFLKNETMLEGMIFQVEGRADGVIIEDEHVIIDEIKSTTRDLDSIDEDFSQLHWAQVICYAYFYSCDYGTEELSVQLSYYNIEDEQTKRFRKSFTKAELWEFYKHLLTEYLVFSKKLVEWREQRDASVTGLQFPFDSYRKGQREMAVSVYQTIMDSENLFIEAPTGIGKTMSAVFPSVKAIGESLLDKIFYLTARSTTKVACNNAVKLLIDGGLRIKAVTFTAKDKSCINDEVKCNPKDCMYAKGHFDRVNEAIIDVLDNEQIIDFDTIREYSFKHRVCPFELQLDLGIYSDIVICDYNYAFDPRVYLRRFFDNPTDKFLFLVDEAHNLIDRGREMFSQEISSAHLLGILEEFTGEYLPIRKAISRLLSKIEGYRPKLDDLGNYMQVEEPEDIYFSIKNLTSKMDRYLAEEKQAENYEKILNLYFEMQSYLRISELYDECFRAVFTIDEEEMIVFKLLCIDTSTLFKEILKRARSSVFFSATLTPMDFYVELLGGNENSYKYHLESPFEQEHLFIGALTISTKYKDRARSVEQISETISRFVRKKSGNYLIFFPSYAYMDMVHRDFANKNEDLDIIAQERSMTEADRDDFIAQFDHAESRIGFAVLGGVFAEGIDLTGDKLIGSIIVSVGLPGIGFERDVIKEFFNDSKGMGFEYAYQYPGMNKVLQAAGRVIRTEEDRGAVVLIDDRFTKKYYRRLMPKHWSHIINYYDLDTLEENLKQFWGTYELEEKKQKH